MKKIALLFLVRKEFNHPRVWEQLLEQSPGRFNLYIHAKEAMEDPYFKRYQIAERVPTEYLYHGKAWQALIREALKNDDNDKFVYLSESCSPLYPLSDIYHDLIRQPHSYMRFSKPWWPRDSEREIVELPIEHRWGNAEWIILNREHARLIADDREILELASKHPNSDHEGYPASLFSLKGCLDQTVYRQTTYADFSPLEELNPYHFRGLQQEKEERFLWNAKRGGSLFARKFTPEFPSERLLQLASERLMALPSVIDPNLGPALETKIARLQAQEELSLANTCALLPMLLNEGYFEVGYEIGAGLGLHMVRILEKGYIQKFYGVDDYKRKNYQGIEFSEEEEEKLHSYVQKRFSHLNLDAELIRENALALARKVPDQSVDFIYFNTEHCLVPMEENLQAWFPKIRKGGIIAGYQQHTFYPQLQKEVKDFFRDQKLPVHQECMEPKFWWVQL